MIYKRCEKKIKCKTCKDKVNWYIKIINFGYCMDCIIAKYRVTKEKISNSEEIRFQRIKSKEKYFR